MARAEGASDHELVARVRRGDDRAFEELYERYNRRIAAFVHGLVRDYTRAEDITQDVFISALRRMRETDRPIAFRPWIYEIARNASIDAFRRARRAELVPLEAGDDAPPEIARLAAPGPSTEGSVVAKEEFEHLQGAFDELSDMQHDILVMRELEGLSYREIGERLNMSQPSVESALFRARRRLHEEYGDLESGAKCESTRSLITTATQRRLGVRENRRLAAHASHCVSCRRQAIAAGIDPALLAHRPRRRRLADKLAGLLPFPWLWRREPRDGGRDPIGLMATQFAAAPGADQAVSAWGKAVAAAVAVLLAGTGAAVVGEKKDPEAASAAEGRGAAVAGGGSGGAAARPAAAQGAKAAAPAGRRAATRAGGGGPAAAGDPASRTRGERRAASRDKGARRGGTDDAGAPGDRSGAGGTGSGSGAESAPSGGSRGTVVGDTVGGARDTVRQTVGGARDTVDQTVGGARDTVDQTVGGARDTVRQTVDTVQQTAGAVGGVVQQTTGAVRDTVESGTGAVGGTVESVQEAAGGAAGAVEETAGGVVQTVKDTVKSAPTPVSDAGKAVQNTVDRVTGGILP